VHVTPAATPITELPLALIPTAAVPLLLALHITNLRTLAKAPRTATPANAHSITGAHPRAAAAAS
jgi:hypothetical protein